MSFGHCSRSRALAGNYPTDQSTAPVSSPLWRFCSPGLLFGRRCCGGSETLFCCRLTSGRRSNSGCRSRFVFWGCGTGNGGSRGVFYTPYLLLVSTSICLSIPSKRPTILPGLHPQSECPISSYTMLMMQKATDCWRFACFQHLSPSSAFSATPHCSLACRCDGSRAVKAESQNLDTELHKEKKKKITSAIIKNCTR